MRLLTHQYTNPGGRSPNEDCVGYYTDMKIYAWVAADGLGGHSHGELASAQAVQIMDQMVSECDHLDEETVKEIFREMNDGVKALDGPLTTAVCAFSDGKTLYYGNNGDSRFILIRDRKVVYRSNDHSLAFLAYKNGAIRYEDIPSHPAQNRLYHSMGCDSSFAGEFYPPVELMPGDAFLLCTDGFWELVTEKEIERTLNISKTPQEWMSMMLECLEPRLTPTSDNYSAVCVLVRED